MPGPPAYDHVQRGHFHYLLHALVPVMMVVAWNGSTGWVQPASTLAVGAALECLALSFHHLRIADRGDHLSVSFGPLPLFRKRVRYADVVGAARSRSSLIEGWGIHYVPYKGWIWNIEGRDCVRLQLASGRQFTVGSNDAEGLVECLESRIAS